MVGEGAGAQSRKPPAISNEELERRFEQMLPPAEPPPVTGIDVAPEGGTSRAIVNSIGITFSEDMDFGTVNRPNPLVISSAFRSSIGMPEPSAKFRSKVLEGAAT